MVQAHAQVQAQVRVQQECRQLVPQLDVTRIQLERLIQLLGAFRSRKPSHAVALPLMHPY